jgi:hypothetical protein
VRYPSRNLFFSIQSRLTRTCTSKYHRQIHPNADVNPIARKLPTNNINAFDSQDENAPMHSAHDFKAQRVARRTTTKDIVMMI